MAARPRRFFLAYCLTCVSVRLAAVAADGLSSHELTSCFAELVIDWMALSFAVALVSEAADGR